MKATHALAFGATPGFLTASRDVFRPASVSPLKHPRDAISLRVAPFWPARAAADSSALDSTHDAVFRRGMNGEIEYWNRAAEELYGWSAEEVAGRVSDELLKTVFPSSREHIEAHLVRSGRWEGELVHTSKRGVRITVASRWCLQRDTTSGSAAVLVYEIPTHTKLVGLDPDLDPQRETRAMAGPAFGAAVAHEIRQPLTAIVTSAEAGLRFLDRPTPNFEKAKEAFVRIVADGHRAAGVVEAIRSTFRPEPGGRSALDINGLIQEAISVQQGDLQKHGIIVRAEQNRQLPHVRGSRLQLQQVLLNLIANAIDAMAGSKESRVLSVKSEAYEVDKVVVSVADTGGGIPAEHVHRLFTPLCTTKPDGMGMGLAICRAIIEAHGGQLRYVPNTPRGAVFQFTLQTG